MRADRPSITASLVAALRAFYTALPEPYRLAPDPVAARLVPGLLSLPARGVSLLPSAAAPVVRRAASRLTFGLGDNVALRTRAIDDALHEAVTGGAAQLVVLGAGLDARAQRLDALAGVDVFEVDYPSTHRYKAELLARIGARPKARALHRVVVDFERDRLDQALASAGFDPGARSFWIWEGVTVYLTPDAIAATLSAVGALSPPGSRIAVTYTQPRTRPPWIDRAARLAGGALSEPVRGMITSSAMLSTLREAGFQRLSDDGAPEWTARYWPGERAREEWERLAVAERR